LLNSDVEEESVALRRFDMQTIVDAHGSVYVDIVTRKEEAVPVHQVKMVKNRLG
jgi:hypothetical protein